MDELAEKAGRDPWSFRLDHLEDPRAIDVLKTVQNLTSQVNPAQDEGLGFAFCRYKNHAAYCAMAVKLHVDPADGSIRLLKFWVAIDVGEVINPDGLKSQVEGAVIQASAWTLREEVTFDRSRNNQRGLEHLSDFYLEGLS